MKYIQYKFLVQKLNFSPNKQIKFTKIQISDYNIKYIKYFKLYLILIGAFFIC